MAKISSTKVLKACNESQTSCYGNVPEERLVHMLFTQILTLNLANIPNIIFRKF